MDWQTWIVIAIVIAALAYLARRAWRLIGHRTTSGCGSCSTCPTADPSASPRELPLVQIEDRQFKQHRDRSPSSN